MQSYVRERVLLGVCFVLVVAIRLAYVDEYGLWEDEAIRYFLALGNEEVLSQSGQLASIPAASSVDGFAVQPLGQTFHLLKHRSPYFPAFYALQNTTMRMVGTSNLWALKLWNVLFAAIIALCVWALARRTVGPWLAGLAVLLFAISPYDLGVNMQFKAQGLVTAMGALATWSLVRVRESGGAAQARFAILYSLALATALLSHAHALFLVPFHALYVVWPTRCRGKVFTRFLVALAGAAFAGGIWLLYAGRAQMDHLRQIRTQFSGEYHGLSEVGQRLWELVRTNLLPIGDAIPGWLTVLCTVMFLLLTVLGFVATSRAKWQQRDIDLSGWLTFGPVALGVLSFVVMRHNQALWPRYFVHFMPFAWVTMVSGVAFLTNWLHQRRPRSGMMRAVGVAPAVGILSVVLFTQTPNVFGRHASPDMYLDWRAVTHRLKDKIAPGDIVLHLPGGGAFVAFISHWRQENTHMGYDPNQPQATFLRLQELDAKQTWVLSSWGTNDQLSAIGAALQRQGYVPGERLVWPGLIAAQFYRSAKGNRSKHP